MNMQMLVNGVLLGGLYALMGLGFSLQWGISGIVNLSYGAMVILGCYISLECYSLLHLSPFISIIISGAILYALGALIYRTVLQRIVRGGIVFTLILTYAVRLIIENGLLRVWSADYRTISLSYAGDNFQFAGTVVPLVKSLVFVVVTLLVYVTYCFMLKTKTGKGIQAVALDREGAEAVGISVEKMYLINFALGTALAGIAGSLWASVYAFSPDSMNMIAGKVFVIAIIGGLGNIWGAAAGGLLLGLAETVGATLIGSQWQEVIGMAIMVIVLVWRPYGLMGKKFFG